MTEPIEKLESWNMGESIRVAVLGGDELELLPTHTNMRIIVDKLNEIIRAVNHERGK